MAHKDEILRTKMNNLSSRCGFGKCSKCHQDNTGRNWCHLCNTEQFQNEFDKWTSGDREIDKFIQQIQLNTNKYQDIIEWIPFGRLEDVTYLAKGGFGTIKNQLKVRGKNSIAIYGITKNPTENEYMMVISYAKHGSLRNLLNDNSYITDFGLCKPVSENDPEKIYGVIPYMAPETLSRGEYTKASDIYSFGMVMLEVLTSYPPYYNVSHNTNLIMDICKGRKPEIKYEIPLFFKEIMEKCWNFESLNRPTAKELKHRLIRYDFASRQNKIRKQVRAANKSNKNFIKYDPNEMHPEAIYTSRLIPKPTIHEYDTFNSRQQFFSIPDNINVEDEENETQEMECKFKSLEID
ncbi:hypothetical protein Glove_151g106 [Diversispora epigaea]|uniref:Protein kinase domain-containing protein n=1 Tax=Diversispora epigaea TaxID=1348612 RepID=A0A397IXN1_9GLOM|nr:hypothetical protein Glove_151g106 [Diversispora epigaea]